MKIAASKPMSLENGYFSYLIFKCHAVCLARSPQKRHHADEHLLLRYGHDGWSQSSGQWLVPDRCHRFFGYGMHLRDRNAQRYVIYPRQQCLVRSFEVWVTFTQMESPAWVYLNALSSKITSNCLIRAASNQAWLFGGIVVVNDLS